MLELTNSDWFLINELVKCGYIAANVPHVKIVAELKADGSEVTNLDKDISWHLIKKLQTTGYPVVSEETISEFTYEELASYQSYWLVDPIDGTKGFIHGTENFCLMVSFIEDHQSVFTCIYAPRMADENLVLAKREQGVLLAQAQATFSTSQDGSILTEQSTKDLVENDYQQFFEVKAKVTFISTRMLDPEAYQASPSKVSAVLDGTDRNLIVTGSRNTNMFGKLNLPLRPFDLDIRTSAGIKTLLILKHPWSAYLLLGFMSEWDVAPGMCIMQELGGGCFDLLNKRWIEPRIFTRPQQQIGPLLMLTNRINLSMFFDLSALQDLHADELIQRAFIKRHITCTVEDFYTLPSVAVQ